MLDAVLGKVLSFADGRIHAIEGSEPNPRPAERLEWDQRLRRAWTEIAEEWTSFRTSGGRLPRIEDLLDESQGNTGSWQAGLLISGGEPCTLLARQFPETVAALSAVPGLRSALWSVLSPSTDLPEHRGPNAGVLRYHLGVDCPRGSALRVGEVTIPYRNGESILFDDTSPHAAWNSGTAERVTLFCDLLRPLPFPVSPLNRFSQDLLALDRRYRLAPRRADAWHVALNPTLEPVGVPSGTPSAA